MKKKFTKKIIAFAMVMMAVTSLYAQQDSIGKAVEKRSAAIGETGNNELKLNLLLSALALPEITYERLLENTMGVEI
ncbi:uncharacterized DUF497 family protein [Pedobacter sp. UYP30]|uniref:hypothetical protein n=1 Tax=Pedobacter sp. UYP30 TaxID=1756400 RepID=UPI0033969D54